MKIAEAIMDCFVTQRMRDEMVILRYAMDADFDDGLAGLVKSQLAPARESSHVRCELPYLSWRPVDGLGQGGGNFRTVS